MGLSRPRTVDVALAIAATAALVVEAIWRDTGSPGAFALASTTCLPIVWSRRAPIGALVATTAGLCLCLAVFQPYDTAMAVLAAPLYQVASLGDRRRSLVVGAAAATLVVGIILVVASDELLTNTLVRVGIVFGALAVGDAVRSRRETLEAMRERDLRIAQEREQEHLRRIADERLRIAREVHDTVAHALVAINVSAGVASHLRGDPPDPVLTEIMGVSTQALDDLRATLDLLRDEREGAPTVRTLDLDSLTQLVNRANAAGIDTITSVDLNGHPVPLAVGQAGYRILQEALTNVMRHAPASHAHISLRADGDALHIAVHDDGAPTPPATDAGAGHGVLGMQERAAALGGDLTAGPAETGGWCVIARLPLPLSTRT